MKNVHLAKPANSTSQRHDLNCLSFSQISINTSFLHIFVYKKFI